MTSSLRGDDCPLPPHRFTLEQYHRMIEAGILTESDRVELLEGWIVAREAEPPPHDGVLTLVHAELVRALPETYMVRVKSALTLSHSEPEPDFAIVKGPARQYTQHHPGARDTPLVVEVAVNSLSRDRDLKQRVYARARIPIYWIVNIVERQIEVYASPRAGKSPGYRDRKDYCGDQTIPLIISGSVLGEIPVAELLP